MNERLTALNTHDPASDAADGGDGLWVTVDGAAVEMEAEASFVEDETLFFSFVTPEGERECGMSIPADIRPGDVLNAAWCQQAQRWDCELTYDEADELCCFQAGFEPSGQACVPSPEGSSLTLAIERISPDGKVYSGCFAGVLVSFETGERRALEGGRFQITLFDETLAELQALRQG